MTRQHAAGRGYNSKWQKARATYLGHHPLCVMCAEIGRTTPASVVDHVVPHKGDQALFWDRANWQSLCAPCHDRHKQRMERGGLAIGCDVDGVPLSSGHHWRAGGAQKSTATPAKTAYQSSRAKPQNG